MAAGAIAIPVEPIPGSRCGLRYRGAGRTHLVLDHILSGGIPAGQVRVKTQGRYRTAYIKQAPERRAARITERRRQAALKQERGRVIDDAGRKKVSLYIASIRRAIGHIEPGADNRDAIDMMHGYLDEIQGDGMITEDHMSHPKVRQEIRLLVDGLQALGLGQDMVVKRLNHLFGTGA